MGTLAKHVIKTSSSEFCCDVRYSALLWFEFCFVMTKTLCAGRIHQVVGTSLPTFPLFFSVMSWYKACSPVCFKGRCFIFLNCWIAARKQFTSEAIRCKWTPSWCPRSLKVVSFCSVHRACHSSSDMVISGEVTYLFVFQKRRVEYWMSLGR